jgi:chorismate synthase
MSGNSFGKFFKITTFGESHGKAVGVILDCCPAGLTLSQKDIQVELDRRKPGQSKISTARKETDSVEILSGIFEGKTTGTPIAMMVFNEDQRSKDYGKIKNQFRPGHADYTYFMKYGLRDYRGGGRASARETIGRVCAGAVAKKILLQKNIEIRAYVIQVGNIKSEICDFDEIEKNTVRCADVNKAKEMEKLILQVKKQGDSIGAVVEVCIKGVPVGIGEPVFDRLNAELAKAIMSIPAVKGIEFGAGFDVATKLGSDNNDEICSYGFLSNNAGGTLGGISSGQDIIFRFAIKPTSSILIEKKSIDLFGNDIIIRTEGRHDPCLAPRVVPIAESMSALVILDNLLIHKARNNFFSEKD